MISIFATAEQCYNQSLYKPVVVLNRETPYYRHTSYGDALFGKETAINKAHSEAIGLMSILEALGHEVKLEIDK